MMAEHSKAGSWQPDIATDPVTATAAALTRRVAALMI
jgi:hypothetical protein